ncbi:MAG TPA: PRC-barrel domain-containing protein [Solirubrobacterales bacterium]|nr:PRC-barrel domain-containing protein [Solirubrobacterales bacterium]
MDDLGPPLSYLVLEKGAPVYAADGEKVGHVSEVRADLEKDIFDGVVVDRSLLPGDDRLVPADQVDEIYERGVALKLDADAFKALPEPD